MFWAAWGNVAFAHFCIQLVGFCTSYKVSHSYTSLFGQHTSSFDMSRCDTHCQELCILCTLHSGVHNAHSIGEHGNSGHFVGGVVLVQFSPCLNCPLPLLTCLNVTLPVGNCVLHADHTHLFREYISSVNMEILDTCRCQLYLVTELFRLHTSSLTCSNVALLDGNCVFHAHPIDLFRARFHLWTW
jgi:hypothetical protein